MAANMPVSGPLQPAGSGLLLFAFSAYYFGLSVSTAARQRQD